MTHSKIRSTYGSLAIAVFASLMLVACEKAYDPQTSLTNAKQYLEQKDATPAIIELKNALQNNSDLAEARFLLGKAYLLDSQGNAAEIELRKALTLKFDSDLTLPLVVSSMVAQGKAEEALTEFGQLKMHSAEARAEFASQIGIAYLATGQLDKAQNKFIEAQKFKPDYLTAVLGQAGVLTAKEDFNGALAKADTVLAKDPKNVLALMFKGDLYRAQNQLDKAVTAYELAINNEPKNLNAHLNLANTYFANGQIGAARAQIEFLDKLAPKQPGVNYFKALVAFNDKDYEKADEFIQRTVLTVPDNVQGLLLAGLIELQLNRPALSEAHLKRVLALEPNNLFALKKLATLYIIQKQTFKAEEILKSAIKIAPDDSELLGLAGDIALANGQVTQASRYLDQATQVNPASARILTQSALAQFAQGNSERAIAQLESASRLEASNVQPDLLLILAYAKRKEYDKALQSWESIRKRQPNDPLIYNLQAAILLNKQDIPAARKALEHALAAQPTNIQAASNLAQLDLNDKKPDAAKQRFLSILEKDKTNLDAMLALADLEQLLGAPRPDVLKRLNEAKLANPAATQPVLAIAKFHTDAGDTKQALATINEALTALPKNQQLLDTVGMLQIRAGEVNQAVETYTQLVADHPNQARYSLRLGEAQLSAGKIEDARAAIAKAVELSPDDTDLQVAAVNAFLSTGKVDEAFKVVDQIRNLAPKSPNLAQLEGDAWMAKGDASLAAAAYRRALSTGPTNGLLMKTHQSLLLAGKKSEAESILTDWLRAHPDDIPVQMYAADSSMNAGDFGKAKMQYGNLLSKQPNNPLLLNNMAWASFQLKDVNALSYAEKAYALAPSSPDIVDTLGWVLVEQGQVKRGIELLENANTRFPKHVPIKLHLAKAFVKDGRKDAARDLLKALVKDSGDSLLGKESAQLLTTL